MRSIKSVLLVVVLCIALPVGFCRADTGPTIPLVPAGALVIVKVNNLEGVSKKVADFCGSLGLTQMEPDLADPLGSLLKQIGVSQGLNRSGNFIGYMVDPETMGDHPDKSMVLLFPVSDYGAFMSNFADAKATGDITAFHFKTDLDFSYAAHWDNYAAISPSQSLIATKPDTLFAPNPAAAKELDGKDATIVFNIDPVRARALKAIADAQRDLPNELEDAAKGKPTIGKFETAKFVPLIKVVAEEALSAATTLVSSADSATFSANLATEGVGLTYTADFKADSPVGKGLAGMKSSDASLLSGVPDSKYLLVGGTVSDPALTGQLFDKYVSPIQAEIMKLGSQYYPANDLLAGLRSYTTSTTSDRFGLFVPVGTLGQVGLVQGFNIIQGDSKTVLDGMRKMNTASQALQKNLGYQTPGMVQVYTNAGKTLDSVTFDTLKTTIDATAQTPEQAQMMQFIGFIYGPNGVEADLGCVNDQNLLYAIGLSDAQITTVDAAIRTGEDPVGHGAEIKSVAAQLPANRTLVVYLPLDQWANTGLNFAKQFSIDTGVKLPDDLPPVGITAGADGPIFRIDSYIPTQLVQSMTSAGMQMYMSTHQQNSQNPPAGGL